MHRPTYLNEFTTWVLCGNYKLSISPRILENLAGFLILSPLGKVESLSYCVRLTIIIIGSCELKCHRHTHNSIQHSVGAPLKCVMPGWGGISQFSGDNWERDTQKGGTSVSWINSWFGQLLLTVNSSISCETMPW